MRQKIDHEAFTVNNCLLTNMPYFFKEIFMS